MAAASRGVETDVEVVKYPLVGADVVMTRIGAAAAWATAPSNDA